MPTRRAACLFHLTEAKIPEECRTTAMGQKMRWFPCNTVSCCLHCPGPSSRLLCVGCGGELPVSEQEHLQKVNLCLEAAAPKKIQPRSGSQGLSVGQGGSCWHGRIEEGEFLALHQPGPELNAQQLLKFLPFLFKSAQHNCWRSLR